MFENKKNITKTIQVEVDGRSHDVVIEDVFFSTRQEVVGDSSEPTSKAQSGTRTTYLRCHLSFSFDSASLSPLRGCVVVDLQKLTEIKYDEDGHFISLTSEPLKYKTVETSMNAAGDPVDGLLDDEVIKSMIAKHIKSDRLDKQESDTARRLLSDALLIEGLPNMYH